MATQNRLLEQLHNEPFALCFSGQGFDWISSLRGALADGARDRANEVAAAAARILEPVAGQLAAARPQGFEPIKWAENGADGIDLVRAAV
ncbi:MAG: ACP S-malonyltransferase, partial [Eikenella corrodens]